MLLLVFLSALFIASGGGAELGDVSCDSSQLDACVEKIPRTPVGLPKTRADLDAHCQVYHTGMSCMDAWVRRCLPNDGQRLLHMQIGGARALMRFLCTNETALRKDFLREQNCWARISPEWSGCVNELQDAVRDIADRAQLFTYLNRNGELCCARDDFMSCVSQLGRGCSAAAGSLLRRMAWVLAQDVAACSFHRTTCRAHHHLAAPILTLTALMYPARL